MDNNILTQVGFVVLIGLAAKNAILIVEFARQLEDRGPRPLRRRGRGGAAAAAADPDDLVRLHPRRGAAGLGDRRRRGNAPGAGTAVFSGMIGVTAFGLIFTPVFYVITRWMAGLFSRRSKAAGPHGVAQPAE